MLLKKEAYSESAIKKNKTEWDKWFHEGRVNGEMMFVVSTHLLWKMTKLLSMFKRLFRWSVEEMVSEIGISVESCHCIILHNDMKIHWVCQHIVLKMLSADQKEHKWQMAGNETLCFFVYNHCNQNHLEHRNFVWSRVKERLYRTFFS